MISTQDKLYLQHLRTTLIENCKNCNGCGYTVKGECECTRLWNIEFEKARAGVPQRYRQFNLSHLKNILSKDTPKLKKYLKEIKTYKSKGTGLLLSGDYNSGKATVASVILNELISKGYKKCGYLEYPQLIHAIRTFLKVGTMDEKIEHIINNAEFMVIDGVADTIYFDSEEKVLLSHFISVLDRRLDFCFPTILTANKQQLMNLGDKKLDSMLSHNFIEINLKANDK